MLADLVKIGAFQSQNELFEGAGLLAGERKKLETVVISPAMTEDSAYIPGCGQTGKRKVQGHALAESQFGGQQHPNAGLRQVFAMSLQALVAARGQQRHQHREAGAVARVPSESTARRVGEGSPRLGGHAFRFLNAVIWGWLGLECELYDLHRFAW